MDLITHIYEHYGRIIPLDMAVNDEILQASYKTEEPIESLIKRINECADFATASGEPVSETQLVHIA